MKWLESWQALVDVLRRGIKGEEVKMLEKEEAGGEEKRREEI